jgi:hypothetical protein
MSRPTGGTLRQIVVSVLFVVIAGWANEASVLRCYAAEEHQYSVKEVCDALSAAEAQFVDLTLRFTSEGPHPIDPDATVRFLTETTYIHKLPEDWTYLEEKFSQVDPATQKRVAYESKDNIAAFDGTTTTILETTRDRNGQCWAEIFRGKKVGVFDNLVQVPHFWLFRASPVMTYAQVLSEGKFKVLPTRELIGNIPCIRVSGQAMGSDFDLWLDPSKSFLPMKSRVKLSSPGVEAFFLTQEVFDPVKLENGMWYPKRIRRGNLETKNKFVTYDITEVSARPLRRESFEVRFPAQTKVNDMITKQVYVTVGETARPSATTQDAKQAEDSLKKYVDDARNVVKK